LFAKSLTQFGKATNGVVSSFLGVSLLGVFLVDASLGSSDSCTSLGDFTQMRQKFTPNPSFAVRYRVILLSNN